MAALNGQFDLALILLERRCGSRPGRVHRWSYTPCSPCYRHSGLRRSNYPQPRAQDDQRSEYMEVLEGPARRRRPIPNVRLNTHLWYWEFGLTQDGARSDRRHAVLARRVRPGSRGHETTRGAWRRSEHPDSSWPAVGMRERRQQDGRQQEDSRIALHPRGGAQRLFDPRCGGRRHTSGSAPSACGARPNAVSFRRSSTWSRSTAPTSTSLTPGSTRPLQLRSIAWRQRANRIPRSRRAPRSTRSPDWASRLPTWRAAGKAGSSCASRTRRRWSCSRDWARRSSASTPTSSTPGTSVGGPASTTPGRRSLKQPKRNNKPHSILLVFALASSPVIITGCVGGTKLRRHRTRTS